MIKNFSLPAYMDKNTNKSSITQVKKHLNLLELQECALSFLEIFNDVPALKSFSFSIEHESNDEGGTYMYLSVRNVEVLDESEVDDDELRDDLSDTLNSLGGDACEQFLYHLSDSIISTDNVAKLVEKAMGQDVYQKWQLDKTVHAEKALLETTLKAVDETQPLLKI